VLEIALFARPARANARAIPGSRASRAIRAAVALVRMRARFAFATTIVAFVALAPFAARGGEPKPTASTTEERKTLANGPSALRPKLAIERYTLGNGMRVVLNAETTSPTLAVVVWYDVGSRNEQPGEGGFAHLFEHMMFAGSARVPRGVHDEIVEGRGGILNASTSEDWTRYFQLMPSSELPVTLFLEADRMASLKVDEEAFENQRKVVQEEYRMRVDNAPYVKGYFRLMELVYEGYPAYAHPAIGSMAELDAAKFAWVDAFHRSYYGPNNAVLVVAGDIEGQNAKGLIEKYFGAIPKITPKPYPDRPFAGRTTPTGPEPVLDPNARTPGVLFGWSIPRDGDPQHYALEVAAEILAGGESSRFKRKLVKELAIAQEVSVSTEDHRGPDAFVIDAQLTEKGKVEEVEKVLLAEIDDLGKRGPSAAELARARAKIEHAFLFGLQANLSRAMALAKFEGHRGDATLLAGEVDRYLAVTADDVKAAVKTHLVRDRLAHVRVLPPAKTDDPKKPTTKAGKNR
jgi:zinc protease